LAVLLFAKDIFQLLQAEKSILHELANKSTTHPANKTK
jgi:hypothetical protein